MMIVLAVAFVVAAVAAVTEETALLQTHNVMRMIRDDSSDSSGRRRKSSSSSGRRGKSSSKAGKDSAGKKKEKEKYVDPKYYGFGKSGWMDAKKGTGVGSNGVDPDLQEAASDSDVEGDADAVQQESLFNLNKGTANQIRWAFGPSCWSVSASLTQTFTCVSHDDLKKTQQNTNSWGTASASCTRSLGKMCDGVYRISPNYWLSDRFVVNCRVDTQMAASGWYVLQGGITARFTGITASQMADLVKKGASGQVYSENTLSLQPSSRGVAQGGIADRFSAALGCVGEATCTTSCRLAMHGAADLHASDGGGHMQTRIPLEDLMAYNDWELQDGRSMGKFSVHNRLEPRHRTYYLALHTTAEKAASMDTHKKEEAHEMYKSRLMTIDHLLYVPKDSSTNRIKFPEVRGLSHAFPAYALCKNLDIANLDKMTMFGGLADDFKPLLWKNKATFMKESGISIPMLYGDDAERAQKYSTGLTRRWARVRCDPLDARAVDLTASPLSQSATAPPPGLYYPPCLYAIDSTNKFLGAMQLEFGQVESSNVASEQHGHDCEAFWWLVCGGGSTHVPVAAEYPDFPSHVVDMLNGPENDRMCLCTGPLPGRSSTGWTRETAEAVRECSDMSCGAGRNPELSGICPPRLVSGACALFECPRSPARVGGCGYRAKTAQEALGFSDEAGDFHPPCTARFPYAKPDALPATLMWIDEVWQLAVSSGGQFMPTGEVCDVGQMQSATEASGMERLTNYDAAAMVASVGVLGMHLAVMLVPPFGVSVGKVPSYTDAGKVCLVDLELWLRRIKTSNHGYFYHPTSAELTAVTATEVNKWSRNPQHLVPPSKKFAALKFSVWRSASAARGSPTSGDYWCLGMQLALDDMGVTCGETFTTYVEPSGLTNMPSRLVMSGDAWSGYSGDWVMRRLDDTCMCTYRFGVDCPLFMELVSPYDDSLVYKALDKSNSFSCCSIMKSDTIKYRMDEDFEALISVLGKPLTPNTYTLMRIGFRECPFSGSVSRQFHFGFACPTVPKPFPFAPMSYGTGGGTVVSTYNGVWSQHSAKFIPDAAGGVGFRSGGVTAAPAFLAGEDLTESLWYFKVPCSNMFTRFSSVLTSSPNPTRIRAAMLTSASYSNTEGCVDMFLKNVPVFSSVKELHTTDSTGITAGCNNWAGGCHYVEYLAASSGEVTTSSGDIASMTCLKYLITGMGGAPSVCKLPWHGWWGFHNARGQTAEANALKDEHGIAFLNAVFDVADTLYMMTFSDPWGKVTGSNYAVLNNPSNSGAASTIEETVPLFTAGDATKLGRIMYYCPWVGSLSMETGRSAVSIPVQFKLSCHLHSGDYPRNQNVDDGTEGATFAYVFGAGEIPMWVPSCDAGYKNPFCLIRASHCATTNIYSERHWCAEAAHIAMGAIARTGTWRWARGHANAMWRFLQGSSQLQHSLVCRWVRFKREHNQVGFSVLTVLSVKLPSG
jgi:hypothetical protein